jgi:hypothetical protein
MIARGIPVERGRSQGFAEHPAELSAANEQVVTLTKQAKIDRREQVHRKPAAWAA